MTAAIVKWLLKYWPYVLGVFAVILFVIWFSHARYSAGERAGRAHIQALWDEDEAAELAAAAKIAEDNARIEEERARKAKEIEDALQAKLDAITADARSLSERLRYYQARRCANAVPSQGSATPVADDAPGVPFDGGAIGEATDNHFAACARDAQRLKEWQVWYSEL